MGERRRLLWRDLELERDLALSFTLQASRGTLSTRHVITLAPPEVVGRTWRNASMGAPYRVRRDNVRKSNCVACGVRHRECPFCRPSDTLRPLEAGAR